MQQQLPQENAPGAVSALVLGILGLVLCPILSPFAWSSGAEAEKHARTGRYSGGGLATAGKVLGIVGTVILIISIVAIIAIAATGGFSDDTGVAVGFSGDWRT